MTTNEETEALIMELRTTASDARAYASHALSRRRGIESANYDAEAGLYERAADGLAALTTPQDGGDALAARQPTEDDREALLQLALDHDPDDCHPDDQKRCKCGVLIGESDGVVVTADGWGHLVDMILAAGFSRAAVPDVAPTLCVECNEVEVLGKPEHRVLCMDCAYETGRAAVPDAATAWDGCDCHVSAAEHMKAAYDEVVAECNAFRSASRKRHETQVLELTRVIDDLEKRLVVARSERNEATAVISRDRLLSAVNAVPNHVWDAVNEIADTGGFTDALLAALDGAPEPEYEWGAALVADPSEATAHADKETALKNIKGWNESSARIKRMGRHTSGPAMLVRRRKAGPWMPVESEQEPVWHYGRSFSGTRIEDSCACKQQACGLVAASDAEAVNCEQHALLSGMTIRQSHLAENCPGASHAEHVHVAECWPDGCLEGDCDHRDEFGEPEDLSTCPPAPMDVCVGCMVERGLGKDPATWADNPLAPWPCKHAPVESEVDEA